MSYGIGDIIGLLACIGAMAALCFLLRPIGKVHKKQQDGVKPNAPGNGAGASGEFTHLVFAKPWPSVPGPNTVDVQSFSETGTWVKPPTATAVRVILSGERTGMEIWLLAKDLPDTVLVEPHAGCFGRFARIYDDARIVVLSAADNPEPGMSYTHYGPPAGGGGK
jgi:hypothetical protein